MGLSKPFFWPFISYIIATGEKLVIAIFYQGEFQDPKMEVR